MAGSRDTFWHDGAIARVAEDEADEIAERVRARMEGWDAGDLTWRRFAVDDNGNLLIAGGGIVIASLETTSLYEGSTALTPKRAFANVAAGQTDSALVAAVTSKKIRVIAVFVIAGATATNLTFNTKPGGAGTAITPLLANAANGGLVLPFNPLGWFQTSAGEGLSVTTGAGATTGIHVGYVEVS